MPYRGRKDSEQPIVLFDYQPGGGREYPWRFSVIIAAC
jgi:hypothetical protein